MKFTGADDSDEDVATVGVNKERSSHSKNYVSIKAVQIMFSEIERVQIWLGFASPCVSSVFSGISYFSFY